MKKKVKIGLIGVGTVGRKVLSLVCDNKDRIERKVGARLEFSYICDSRRSALKKVPCSGAAVTDWKKVIDDPSVDIVVELIGGLNPARQVMMQSLEKGKHIVTANKAVLSECWHEIFSLARARQRVVYFEASVAGGVPVIQALNEGLAANNIESITGILNGTCNYILTRMTKENVSFASALKEAQKAGFAEVNPHLDIEGVDTVHKLAILSSIAWADHIKPEYIYREGISGLSGIDVKFAREEFGYVIKLLGVARRFNGSMELYVRPCLIPLSHPFAGVEDEVNAVLVNGDACGKMIFQGKGAGGYPAASAVVSDIMYLARQVAIGVAGKIPDVDYLPEKKITFLKAEDSVGSYYLRVNAVDRPGVLAQVSGILGRHKVSIASVFQKKNPFGRSTRGVPIIMLTHGVREGSIRAALAEIDKLKIILSKSIILRIEN